jgi:lysophospholipase L1-like esterase
MASGARGRVVLLLLGTAVGLAGAEAVARAWWTAPWYERLAADQERSQRRGYTRNRWMLRDRDYAAPRPDARTRILVLGDSFTYGLGVRDDEAIFPAILETRLNERGVGTPPVEVLNSGIVGSLTEHWVRNWDQLAPAFDPDVLLIVFFHRDGTARFFLREFFQRIRERIVERNERMPLYRHSHLFRILRDAIDRQVVSRVYTRGMVDAYVGTPEETEQWRRTQADLLYLRDAARARRASVGLAVFPVLVELDEGYPFREISEVVMRFADENGIAAHDLLPAFLGRDAPGLWVSDLDQHPNARGHAIAAESLLPFVEQLVRAARAAGEGRAMLGRRGLRQRASRDARDEGGDGDRRQQSRAEQEQPAGAGRAPGAAGERRHVARDLARVDVQERARQHAQAGDEVVGEAHAREAERVVQQVEREDRR